MPYCSPSRFCTIRREQASAGFGPRARGWQQAAADPRPAGLLIFVRLWHPRSLRLSRRPTVPAFCRIGHRFHEDFVDPRNVNELHSQLGVLRPPSHVLFVRLRPDDAADAGSVGCQYLLFETPDRHTMWFHCAPIRSEFSAQSMTDKQPSRWLESEDVWHAGYVPVLASVDNKYPALTWRPPRCPDAPYSVAETPA
jgi:hypothetical protein